MIQENNIQKIAEFMLQNIDMVSLAGLYNGKAGISLSLFLASGYLQDEHLEDIAYRLFQESIIIKNYDMGFENGLTGIGYVMLYLIENKQLEADFDEIFGIQYETIIKSFENIEKDPVRLVNSLQAIYFLSNASKIKKGDVRIQKIIKKIFEGLELFLTVQFQDFADINYINKKVEILTIYMIYLKLIVFSGYSYFSHSLLENYAALYRKGRIVSSLETGFYLKKVADKYNIFEYDDVINENLCSGIKNLYPKTLSLKERIDLTKITNNIKCEGIKESDFIPHIESMQNEKIIQNLLKTIDEKSSPFGYGAGLGRLLIYYVNEQVELL